MPLYVSVPLPGPFRYVSRLGGKRPRRRRKPLTWRTRHRSALYWLLGAWALEAEFWMLYGLAWLAVRLCQLGAALLRERRADPGAPFGEAARLAAVQVPWREWRIR